jgi:hypothetical protein
VEELERTGLPPEARERRKKTMNAFGSPHRDSSLASALILRVRASAPSLSGRVLGGFTLPVTARWGRHLLPLGVYTFVVPSGPSRGWVYVRTADDSAVLFAASEERASRAPRNEITLVHDVDGYRIHSLALRDAGRIFSFGSGRPEPVHREAHRRFEVLSLRLGPGSDPREIVLTLRS